MNGIGRPGVLKGRFASFALGIFLIASCSDSTAPENELFMRFKVNGAQVEYTNTRSLIAAFSQAGGQHNAVITGFDAATNMGVQVFDDAAIQVAEYRGYTINNSLAIGVLIGYEDASGDLYAPDATAPIEADVTITEITPTRVRGTFSGRVSAMGLPDILITEGAFAVTRAN